MKKSVITLMTLACAMTAGAERIDTTKTYQLQDVQVTATRATKKTPMAFEDMAQQQIREVNF